MVTAPTPFSMRRCTSFINGSTTRMKVNSDNARPNGASTSRMT